MWITSKTATLPVLQTLDNTRYNRRVSAMGSVAIGDQTSNLTLPFARLRLHYRVSKLPDPEVFLGSAWRGVFGHELLARGCARSGCMSDRHSALCRYLYLFDTPAAEGRFSKSGSAPRPIVLGVPWRTAPTRGMVTLHVTLFGRAVGDAGLVVECLRHGGKKIHPYGPFDLAALETESETGSGSWVPVGAGTRLEARSAPIPPAPPGVRVVLVTPLRLSIENRTITPERFRVAFLFSNVLRRVSLLAAHHTDSPLVADFGGLTRLAQGIPISRGEIDWHDMTRYSNRQNRQVPNGGLLGSFEFSLRGHEALWPYLWIGQFTHAGKGAAMGLGRYQLWMT